VIGVIVGALEFFWWIVFVVLWVVFIALTMNFARMKGRSPL
jgi:hypothetical protein